MAAEVDNIVLVNGLCAFGSVHTRRMHHRFYPELWVECGSDLAAAQHLVNQLYRALDGASSSRHRDGFLKAIDEVKAFSAILGAEETHATSALRGGNKRPKDPIPERNPATR